MVMKQEARIVLTSIDYLGGSTHTELRVAAAVMP